MAVTFKHLVFLFTTLTWRVYMANDMVGSTDDDDDDEINSGDFIEPEEFYIKIIAWRPTQFFIYWLHPDTNSTVSYYLVSYNVTVHYRTTAGERIFYESHTTKQLSTEPTVYKIPLYNTNSTYMVRVAAVTQDKETITSDDYIISEDKFKDYMGQNDSVFIQLGLELTDPQASIDCLSFESDYGNVLLHTRSQLIQAVQDICTSVHNDNGVCATWLTADQFRCHSNRLVYIGRVVGTIRTNATISLKYLMMLSSVEISLHNQTFSRISSPSCPLSIPSAEESNCKPQSVTTENNNTTMASNEHSNDIVIVIVVTLGCLVGIISMTFCIAGVMYVCGWCNHYQGDIESVDLESEDSYKVKPNSPQSDHRVEPIQQLKLSSITTHSDLIPSSSYSNSHHKNHNNNVHTTTV